MSASTRRILSFLALAVAAGLLFLANGLWYFDRNLLDSSAFADHATKAIEKEAVRRELAREIVSEVEREIPAASGRQAELEAAADRIIATAAFRRIFRSSVREIHRFAFDDRDTRLLLDLFEVGSPLRRAAERAVPGLAAQIPPGFDARVAEISEEVDRTMADLRDFSQRAGGLADITLILGLICIALALLLATDRFRALTRVGWLMAALGLIYLVAYYVGRALVGSEPQTDAGKDAVKDVWDALLGGLRDWNLALLIAGLLVVVVTFVARARLQDRNAQGWDEAPTQRW